MKRIYLLLNILIAAFIFTSCEKDEDRMYALPAEKATAPVLSLNGTSDIVVTPENVNDTLSAIKWTAADFGEKVIVNYVLEISDNETFEGDKKQVIIGNSITEKGLVGYPVNDWGLAYGGTQDKSVKLFARIASTIAIESPSVTFTPDTVFSNSISLTVTPDASIIAPDLLYIAGNHNGWTQQASLQSPEKNGVYTGYSYLDGGLKFCSDANWNGTNYGAGAAEETLDTNGGDIISTAGFYYITVDTKGLTYKFKSVVWGVVGAIIDDSWSIDKPLKWDATNKVLSITADFKAGEFKFRQDASWDVSIGEGGLGGGNLSLPEAGNYTLTLDLSDPLAYTYTITKN